MATKRRPPITSVRHTTLTAQQYEERFMARRYRVGKRIVIVPPLEHGDRWNGAG